MMIKCCWFNKDTDVQITEFKTHGMVCSFELDLSLNKFIAMTPFICAEIPSDTTSYGFSSNHLRFLDGPLLRGNPDIFVNAPMGGARVLRSAHTPHPSLPRNLLHTKLY